jgi:hypothetical protein
MTVTKSEAKRALGLQTDAELAQFFDISKQAVSQWRDDRPLPDGRQWELRARRPDVFGEGEGGNA